MWSAFETAGRVAQAAEAPFKALNTAISNLAADAEKRAEQRREAQARAAAEAARLREEEARLTPQERATRELIRAFEGQDASLLSAAIDAGQAAGLDSTALLPAVQRLTELEAAAALERSEYDLIMATRRAMVGGKAETMRLPIFVEEAASAGVTGDSLRTACDFLDKKNFGDQISARARAAASQAAPDASRSGASVASSPTYAPASSEARATADRLLEERRAAQMATAASQAAEAARATAAREDAERARVEAEMAEARQQLQRSVSLPGPQRTKLLRELQVKWHPDRYNGDPVFADRALELSMKVNEAMKVARENAKARGEL